MYVEFPKFRRCCFCIPIRYGLLTWAYMKLIPLIFLVAVGVADLVCLKFLDSLNLICAVFDVIITFVNISSSILLITAAHRKSTKLLRIFFYYDLGVAVVNVVNLIVGFFYPVALEHDISLALLIREAFLAIIVFHIICFGMQVYILLMVRSLREKIANKENFKFVNNAVDAECVYVGDRNNGKNDDRPVISNTTTMA